VAREHVIVLTATGECLHMGHDVFFIALHLFRHSLWNLWLHVVVAVGHHSRAWQHTGQSSSIPVKGFYGVTDRRRPRACLVQNTFLDGISHLLVLADLHKYWQE
jgi:hypothetical protein